MSLEDIAKRVVTLYGITAGYNEIDRVLYENGFQDEDHELSNRVAELVKSAVVKVKVKYA